MSQQECPSALNTKSDGELYEALADPESEGPLSDGHYANMWAQPIIQLPLTIGLGIGAGFLVGSLIYSMFLYLFNAV